MTGKDVKQSKEEAKKERLAQALRANLKRRKAQSRERIAPDQDGNNKQN